MNLPSETAFGFLNDAKEFLAAAELILNRSGEVSLPSYFLLGRSVELSLKAFLLASGMSGDELKYLKKYGHNLEALLNEARIRGIENEVSIDDVELAVLELLNYDYSEKRFEYRVSGETYRLPLIDVTLSIARRLSNGLQKVCANR
jgi:HEPN domain-containing protein